MRCNKKLRLVTVAE